MLFGTRYKRLFAVGLVAGTAACSGPGTDVVMQRVANAEDPTSPGRYLVQFTPGNAAQGKAAVAAAGGDVLVDLPQVSAAAVDLPDAAIAGLQNNPNIALIEPDPKRFPLAESTPYGIAMVQAPLVSDANASAMTVCIIDSGYAAAHEDLSGGAQVTGNDSSAGPWNQDGCGHGTHVAGTIAAVGGNGVGVVGVLPSAGSPNIHIERVFGNNCRWAYASELIDAAFNCEAAGANVISMSLGCASGGPFCYSSVEDQGFALLYSHGLLSVAAASNDGKSWYSYPASYDSVISVAAIDQNKNRAWFSNANSQVELAAPGVGVLSTVPSGCTLCDPGTDYEYWSGTSMATPHVAGVAALIWSHAPSKTAQEVRDALTGSAEDLGPAGRDGQYGFGLVQAEAALAALGGTTSPQCNVDSDCDDLNPCTDDVCVNGACAVVADDGNTCDGGICCGGSCTTPACATDSDCSDDNSCTANTCLGAGTCDASCSSTDLADESSCSVANSAGVCCRGACQAGATSCDLVCLPVGAVCSSDADCCRGRCRGRPGQQTCR
jgi:subtilisin